MDKTSIFASKSVLNRTQHSTWLELAVLINVAASAAVLLWMILLPTTSYAQGSPPVWGFADLHTHPAAHLAFGTDENGNNGMMWGKPGMDLATAAASIGTDLPPCLNTHTVLFPLLPFAEAAGLASMVGLDIDALMLVPVVPVPITSLHGAPRDYVQLATQRLVLQGLDDQTTQPHHSHGAPGFEDWPGALTVEHQQMHITAIKRAFDGGLRLMVAAASDNQLLSTLWSKVGFNVVPSVPNPVPNFDFNSAVRQLAFIRSLVAANSSWMQIVKTPAEARQAINANKLAVILSLEMDSLSADQILALASAFDVRHVIPIHLANSPFGGSAVYNDAWNTNSWFLNNHQFIQVDFDAAIGFRLQKPQDLHAIPGGATVPISISDSDYGKLGYEAQVGGHKNQLGITDPSALLRLMQAGLLIDVAHMSEKATEMAITQAEVFGYPLMDSHTGIRPPVGGNERSLLPAHAMRIGNLGGVIGLGPAWDPNSSDPISDFLTAYENLLSIMGGRGIALGSDANGFQPLISKTKAPLKDYKGNVAAKFSPPPSVATPNLGQYQLGTFTYDINKQGIANYGMLPDFLEALSEQSTVAPSPTVTALFHSAEDTIQMWEKVTAASANAVPPPVTCKEPDISSCLTNAENQASTCFKQAGSSDPKSARCDALLSGAVAACNTKLCQPVQPTQLTVKERRFPSMDDGRFTLSINQSVESGNTGDQGDTGFVNVKVGSSVVKEGAVCTAGTQLSNYILQFGGDCPPSDISQGPFARPVTVGAGQQKTCSVTNLGFPALTFLFIDQSNKPGQFNIQFDQRNVATSANANGAIVRATALATATHQIAVVPADTTTNLSNYGFRFGRDCAAESGINPTKATTNLAAGDEKICLITALTAGVGNCPAGQKPCGDASGLTGDPEICVDSNASCNALCKPNSRGVAGTFCEIDPKGAAICAYPPQLCP